ncbi:MAG: hypothetical protein JXB03_05005 [Spirochaetales bacterium]|nr:hypothetical protein [Spirochaetales bacterium]
MSIKPIDIQTLFSHINQVGKEQAAQKDALLMQQTVAGSEIAEETQRQDESVNDTKATSDGPGVVDEEGSSSRHQGRKDRKKRDDSKKEQKQVFTDPNLGTHVDIKG